DGWPASGSPYSDCCPASPNPIRAAVSLKALYRQESLPKRRKRHGSREGFRGSRRNGESKHGGGDEDSEGISRRSRGEESVLVRPRQVGSGVCLRFGRKTIWRPIHSRRDDCISGMVGAPNGAAC